VRNPLILFILLGNILALPAGEIPPGGKNPLPRKAAVNHIDPRVEAEANGSLSRVILMPWKEATLSADTAGKILKLPFPPGSRFPAGAELATLDDTVCRAARAKAEAVLKAARTALQATIQLRSHKDASIVEVENARRDVSVAEAELALAVRNLASCHLTAPYAGRVAEVFPNEYEQIEPGRPLLRIIDDRMLLGHVFLPGAHFDRVRENMPVTIWVEKSPAPEETAGEILPGIRATAIPGTLVRVAPLIDAASGYFAAGVRIDNTAGRLKAGATAWLRPADLGKTADAQ